MRTNEVHASLRPRIGLDLHSVDGAFQGSRTHCLELFSRVIALTPECDFFAMVSDSQKLLSFSPSFALPNVTIVPLPARPSPFRLLWQLPQMVRQCRVSLLHTQYISPPLPGCATAVTVHDILFESHRDYFEKLFVLRSRLLVPLSVRRSVAVFTVSKYSREQICNTYSVHESKVHIIPNGVDPKRFYPGEAGTETARSFGLERGSYFLTVGRLEPRKNHATLLRAWALLAAPRPPLVIVGQRDFQYHESLDLIRTLNLTRDVMVLEDVSDLELPAIYRNAKGFIYCSWAEGFGMPLLEAMSSGIPVVAAANTALSEVCADAALQVDAGSAIDISNAVCALDQRAEIREKLIGSGLARAQEFTWQEPAETVRRVYLKQLRLPLGSHQRPSSSNTDAQISCSKVR